MVLHEEQYRLLFDQKISEELFVEKYMHHGETSPIEVFQSIATDIASVEKSKQKKLFWADSFYQEMVSGRFIPGGRILANARPNTPNPYYSNCYTIDVEDTIDGIYTALREDAIISATGGGVGFDISKLRPEGAPTSKGGVSSGPISFLKVFNESAKQISVAGNRRGAHIALLDISHPDVEQFITCKQGDINKELDKFNISVRITDDFMAAVEKDLPWNLTFDGKIYKTLPARGLYELLISNAYQHNEPGVFFIDTVEKFNTGWWAFKADRTNPCLTGDTLLSIQDRDSGTEKIITLKEVVDEVNLGQDLFVKSYSTETDSTVFEKIEWGALTRKNTEVIKLEILTDSGETVQLKCTPDHKILTRNRSWIAAKDLTEDDDIITT